MIPEPPAAEQFFLTPLRADHRVLDCDAVMSSRERLRQLIFDGAVTWPDPPG